MHNMTTMDSEISETLTITSPLQILMYSEISETMDSYILQKLLKTIWVTLYSLYSGKAVICYGKTDSYTAKEKSQLTYTQSLIVFLISGV